MRNSSMEFQLMRLSDITERPEKWSREYLALISSYVRGLVSVEAESKGFGYAQKRCKPE